VLKRRNWRNAWRETRARQEGRQACRAYTAIDTVNDEIKKAGVIALGRQSVVAAYTTAEAWPEEDRVESGRDVDVEYVDPVTVTCQERGGRSR
jgi:hypothetical protein